MTVFVFLPYLHGMQMASVWRHIIYNVSRSAIFLVIIS
jgi:hypothetical protein